VRKGSLRGFKGHRMNYRQGITRGPRAGEPVGAKKREPKDKNGNLGAEKRAPRGIRGGT